MSRLTLAALALVSIHLQSSLNTLVDAKSIWPFGQKKFDQEAFIDAGSLGLGLGEQGGQGRVIALGDWDGDQKLDLFTLSDDKKTVHVNLWNKNKFQYTPSHTITLSSSITNVVPGDFDHDGRLDLLIMYKVEQGDGGWWGGSKVERLGMEVWLGGGENGGFQTQPWTLPISTPSQPIIFDSDGSLRPSLLAFSPLDTTSTESILKVWQNNGSAFTLLTPPLQSPEQACTLASPHSSAFIDIDGDCIPDLVLHCTRPKTNLHFIQIWLNRAQNGYVLSRSYDLPPGSGPLSFADMNRDGSIDIVFPTCAKRSSSTGIGSDCSVNIAYNQQVPICSTEGSQRNGKGGLKCRGWGELCTADEAFDFEFDSTKSSFVSVSLTSLIPSTDGSTPDLLLHPSGSPHIPLPIRIGDYTVDGFPDLLLVISNATASPSSGPFGGSNTGQQVKILQNVPCKKGVAGCEVKGSKRGLKVGKGKGWDALNDIWDATGANWIDLDDDGSLDVLVQRTGEQMGEKFSFIQNNFYHDAFFLKAQVLNGACDGECQPVAGGAKYSPFGVSYSGATYKFTVLDTLGHRVAQQMAQLPQTGYHSLHTPYSFIGLGRTNNYVEKMFVGASSYPPGHTTYLESLIPNSQVIINPPYPYPENTTTSIEVEGMKVKERSKEWKSQLYLKPGDWVPWVGIAVSLTVCTLGGVVMYLQEKEKREDEKERRRALHAINFQAL